MVSLATSSALLLAALAAHQAQAFNVQLVNKCTYTVNLFDASSVQDIAPGDSLTRKIAPNSGAHVFRHTRNAQATREFCAWDFLSISERVCVSLVWRC